MNQLIFSARTGRLPIASAPLLQRDEAGETQPSFPGQAWQVAQAHLGHHFADLPVRPPENFNSAADAGSDDVDAGSPIESIGSLLPSEGGSDLPIGGGGQGAEGLNGPAAVKCPTKTVVEKVIDMTPTGIQKGYRTGYGAAVLMRVEPTGTNWDGAKIVEANSQTKNTCPKEFGISPCSGADTFTVGAASNSSILGALPATSNHFYDYHTSRWNKGSLLHDRNPNDVPSCEIACEQKYSCGGNVIGTHAITRTFTKGTSGSRNVTLVNVTKS
jgi:hypothetical protein